MTKDERRAAMPKVTAFLDDLKEAFGPDYVAERQKRGLVEGTFYATENDLEVGRPVPPPDPERTMDAEQWLRISTELRRRLGDEEYERITNEAIEDVLIITREKP